jgi:hypothetical protein
MAAGVNQLHIVRTLILSAYTVGFGQIGNMGGGEGGGTGIHESRNMHEAFLTNIRNDALMKQKIQVCMTKRRLKNSALSQKI